MDVLDSLKRKVLKMYYKNKMYNKNKMYVFVKYRGTS